MGQEVSDLYITPQHRNTNFDYNVGAQSKESGTEVPHEKFHPASYGVKILLTISNFILAQFIRFLEKKSQKSEDSVSATKYVSHFSTKHFSLR
jgi:hypothetical protein